MLLKLKLVAAPKTQSRASRSHESNLQVQAACCPAVPTWRMHVPTAELTHCGYDVAFYLIRFFLLTKLHRRRCQLALIDC